MELTEAADIGRPGDVRTEVGYQGDAIYHLTAVGVNGSDSLPGLQ